MKAIDKLIFNALATRQRIVLPGVGSLAVEHRPARMPGRNRVEAPLNRVVFSRQEKPGYEALPELIARTAGVDSGEAARLYETWLGGARTEKGVTIGGTGDIRQDFFSPSPELEALLNPAGTTALMLKIRRRTGRTVLAVAAAAACAGVAAFLLIGEPGQERRPAPETSGTIAAATRPQPGSPAGRPAQTVPDSTGTASPQQGETTAAERPAAAPETAPATIPSVSPDLYYVVAGVYSTEKNADTFIAGAAARDGSLSFAKARMGNGKILVSVFSSPQQAEAERERARLAAKHPDLWIYKRKK